jgi:hypothetical protein
MQEHGMTKNLEIQVNVSRYLVIKKTCDNEAIIEAIKDLYKQLVYEHLPRLKLVIAALSKSSELCIDDLKRSIDLKVAVVNAIAKFAELKIEEDAANVTNHSDSSDDDDFEEVLDNVDIEQLIPEHRHPDDGLNQDSAQPSTSGGIKHTGRYCLAPLPSGKLCPRQDKVKCPFHGKIVERDMYGEPISGEDKAAEEKRKANEIPAWQDPLYLKELEAATGFDLTLPSTKRRRRQNKKYPNLKNVKTCDQNPRKRLEKIVFNKSSRQRVIDDLDALDGAKFRKFEDNWNYSFNT